MPDTNFTLIPMRRKADTTTRAAARRELVFAIPPMDGPIERSMAQEDAAKLVQRAAMLAVSAGREGAANALLDALELLEAPQ